MASTKYACQNVEPKKRLLRPRRRGWFQLTDRDQVDDADRAQQAEGLGSPLVRVPVADDRPGELGVEQLEVALQHRGAEEDERRVDEPVRDRDPLRWNIRVWPNVSMNMFAVRLAGRSRRPTSGWPVRITVNMSRTALTMSGSAMAVMTSDTTIATTCMKAPFLWQTTLNSWVDINWW